MPMGSELLMASLANIRGQQQQTEASRAQNFTGLSGIVDRIERADEGDVAVVLDDSGNAFNVPIHMLPEGAAEGSFLHGGKLVSPPTSNADQIRKRLSAGDNGGPINL